MRYYLLTTYLLFCCAFSLLAQGNQVQFGKNRVQYHDDFKEWLEYESPNFTTYWYGKSRNVGQSVVQMAEFDHDAIQNILEHRINNKIELIVYADITDMKQTNIGSEEAFINTAGQTKIVGNKIFVYFNGDHEHLRRQIREGIASVYLNAMLFGSNLQEIVQNAVMMNLPPWFEKGLVSYVGKSWDTKLDNRLKDAMQHTDYENFEELAKQYPQLAGHSLWYFIGQNYGKSTVSNLLYLTRINRSIESGFLYVLGSNYPRIIDSWEEYFKKRYEEDSLHRDSLVAHRFSVKNRRNLPLTQFKLSPDGKKAVYVANEIGKYKVYLHDLETDKREVVHKGGFRNAFQATDYNYPLLAWKPSGYELSVIYERRDVIKQFVYDLNTTEGTTEDMDPQYQRVLSSAYMDNNNMVLSAIVNGYSDLFIYQTLNRQTQRITSDFYDDLDATVVKLENKKGILFASNRQSTLLEKAKLDTILPTEDFDIFYYDFASKSSELIRVTDTPLANERNPAAIDTTWFAYRSDENGIYNRKLAYLKDVFVYNEKIITLQDKTEIIIHEDSTLTTLDSTLIENIVLRPVYEKQAFSHTNSNYSRGIIELHTASKANKMAELIFKDDAYQFYIQPVDVNAVVEPPMTRFQRQEQSILESISNLSFDGTHLGNENTVLEKTDVPSTGLEEVPPAKEDSTKVDIDNYLFQSEFDDDETPPVVEIKKDKGEIVLEKQETAPAKPLALAPQVLKFRPSKIVPYRLKFRTDFVTTNFDNGLLFGGLDTYAGDKEEFTTPPPGILFKANFKDLFEDYQIEGGIRVPTTFNGTEYFLTFDDRKGRFDKQYAAYRKNTRLRTELFPGSDPYRTEFVTLLGTAQVRYPFDIFRSLRASTTLRNDRRTVLAIDPASFAEPSVNEQRIGAKLEYVFDNTLDVSPNIKNGTRYKLYAEVVKRFRVDLLDKVAIDFDPGVMTVLGLDARHYQRLDKRSILAARLSAATSFGSEKILHYLGGTNGWLFPKFNQDVPQPVSDEFAYQTLAADMRGFSQNIRNGNTFVLLNAELRIPIIQYFSKKTIRSAFLRNFQIMGFFDAGTAWQGTTPFSEENPLNIVSFIGEGGSPVSVEVNYFRDPIVASYGAGIRSVLFGYFVRLDYAWGIETRAVQDPRFFLSLGTDF